MFLFFFLLLYRTINIKPYARDIIYLDLNAVKIKIMVIFIILIKTNFPNDFLIYFCINKCLTRLKHKLQMLLTISDDIRSNYCDSVSVTVTVRFIDLLAHIDYCLRWCNFSYFTNIHFNVVFTFYVKLHSLLAQIEIDTLKLYIHIYIFFFSFFFLLSFFIE